MNSKIIIAAIVALAAGVAIGVFATPRMGSGMMSHDMSQMEGHDMSAMGTPKGDQGEASKAFAMANSAMHTGMDIEFSGNADVDFAKGMIPHHQGAIDMAKVLQKFGKDPELRKLADGIIAAQEGEIAFMKDWLARNSK